MSSLLIAVLITGKDLNTVPHQWELPNLSSVSPDFTTTDVVFIFPHERRESQYICANMAELQKASPYWQMMFNSGFQESQNTLRNISQWKRQFQMDIDEVLQNYHNAAAGAQVPESVRSICPPVSTLEALSLETPVRYVVVTDASMSTYAAILDAIKTGELAASADLGGPPRDCRYYKAIFALAHKLELDSIQGLAIQAYARQLWPRSALCELLSPESMLYPEIKETAMQYVIKHWHSISAYARDDIARVGESGQTDFQQQLLATVDLFERVQKECTNPERSRA